MSSSYFVVIQNITRKWTKFAIIDLLQKLLQLNNIHDYLENSETMQNWLCSSCHLLHALLKPSQA